MNKDDIIKEIKKLNPFLWLENEDAHGWRNTTRDRLIDAYKDYVEAEERVKKIENKLAVLNNREPQPEGKVH